MDNTAQQIEELQVLEAIYDKDWVVETKISGSCYSIKISSDVKLFITIPEDYPSDSPPTYELLAPTLNKGQKRLVSQEFNNIYIDNFGTPVIFQWIEKLKEIVSSEIDSSDKEIEEFSPPTEIILEPQVKSKLNIISGEIIVDRKSVFQGHVCKVTSVEEVKQCFNQLLDNKKISQATHNISAYRIRLPNNQILQDCDDDGEAHAGSRLLHLLNIRDVVGVIVIVSRWYGGIHLGPDRFKHINNAAREVLQNAGFL